MNTFCSIEGCERLSTKRTWCNTHYQRWRRTGVTGGPGKKTDFERFTEKYEVDPDTGCWNWTASTTPTGYGKIGIRGDDKRWRIKYAHRISYEFNVGPIPEGLTIDHLCRRRHCVNPAHLEPVTMAENIYRGEGVAARNMAKTHCLHGHPFDEENTAVRHRPGRPDSRVCKTCARLASRRSWARYEARRKASASSA